MDSYQKREPTGIDEILENLTRDTALGRSLEQAKIWEHWEKFVGPVMAEHGRPHSIRDQQLRIEVDSAVWMHKFSYRKWDILKRINGYASRELVNDLFMILLEDGTDFTEETPPETDSGAR